MKQKLSKLMAQFQIEIGMSYRFPVIEGFAALIFLTPIWAAVLTWQRVSISQHRYRRFTRPLTSVIPRAVESGWQLTTTSGSRAT